MNTSNKQEKLYVWRMDMDAQGKLYTAASMELAPKHSMAWVAANYDTRRRDPVDSIRFNKLMAEINQTYLTDIKGDICVSRFESYEDTMAHFEREGWEIKYDAIHYPTIN